ncbi:MAG: hypothetical protein RLZZ618_3270 [Pseudomonadota bacterium]|jgi:filamentous hemagglutinin family protein
MRHLSPSSSRRASARAIQAHELHLAPIALAAVLALSGLPAWAQPVSTQLPVVRAGSTPVNAVINPNTGTMTNPIMNITQNTGAARAVIEWTNFSIGSAARVNIVQPTAQSVLINRVTGAGSSASEIYGALNANGRVFLVNPQGIVFGAGAQVNVGSLVATTLDLTTAMSQTNYSAALGTGGIDFASGPQGTDVEVAAGATIQTTAGGSILLLGSNQVTQRGDIVALRGQVQLASNDTATIVPLGTSGFVGLSMVTNADFTGRVTLDSGSNTTASGGKIIVGAEDGKTRRDVLSVAGTVSTASSTGSGGSVTIDGGDNGFTYFNGGTVSASSTAANGRGGDITVRGDTIHVASTRQNQRIEADGSVGGGTITIGSNATRDLLINPQATLTADATTNGNGGSVVARATYLASGGATSARFDYGVAEVYGTLLARGGVNGGNGGHIETSGTSLNTALNSSIAGGLQTGTFDARARAAGGLAGSWSIDPFNVTISNNAPVDFSGTYTPTGPGANLRAADISAALDAGTSVEITTGSDAIGADAGNLTLVTGTTIARTAGTTPTTLTLKAHNHIELQGTTAITGTAASPLNVILVSDLDGNGTGHINLLAGSSINTGGGNIVLSGGIDPLTGYAAGDGNGPGVRVAGNLNTLGNGATRGNILIRGQAPGGIGVQLTAPSIAGNDITVLGRSTDGTGVLLNSTFINTASGVIDIRGIATRDANTGFQAVGVDASAPSFTIGSGSLTIAGRGDDNGVANTATPAVGLQFSALNINTATGGSGRITLAGEAANSSGAGITFNDNESGGIRVTAGFSSAQPTLSDVSLGAISSAGLAMDLGTSFLPISVRTNGAINLRPLGVDANGATVERNAPIAIRSIANATSGYIIDPGWLAQPGSGNSLSAAQGIVVGSSTQTGAITLADNAFTTTLPVFTTLSLTLQNEGAGSGGITLGTGNSLRDLGLLSAGNVTQTGPITVTGNLVVRGGATTNVALTQANTIGVLAFDPPATLAVTTQGTLTVDGASIMSYDATSGTYSPLSITDSSAGNSAVLRSLAGSVDLYQPIVMTGNAAVVDLVSPNSVNFVEGTTVSARQVRTWSPVVTGFANPANYYGCVFGDVTACSVSGIALPTTAGRQSFFATQPTVTVAANAANGVSGTALPALTYTNGTLINGDLATDVFSGALATTAGVNSPAGNYAITQGTVTSPRGYAITYTPATLTLAAAPVVNPPPPPPTAVLGYSVESVQTDFLTEFRSDVYGRNLSTPFICTAASLVRDSVGRETKADPLASEWGKVRSQPQLSGCLDVTNGGQCAAF